MSALFWCVFSFTQNSSSLFWFFPGREGLDFLSGSATVVCQRFRQKKMALIRIREEEGKLHLIQDSASASSTSDGPVFDMEEGPEGDLKRAVHSEMMLLQSLLAKKVIDPCNFRERTQGAWEMIGVVSALFLTMDKYCDPIEIYDEELLELVPFCHQIHPFCAGTATLFAASSVVLSMILYCQISFVPDQFLGDWMFALARCVDFPVLCFIVSVVCWCLDLVWIGIVTHGTFGVIFGGLVMIPAACILLLYVRVKSLTNKFLLRAAMV